MSTLSNVLGRITNRGIFLLLVAAGWLESRSGSLQRRAAATRREPALPALGGTSVRHA